MARVPRVVAPGLPHHVTQRGNRRQRTFFGEADYEAHRDLMAEFCGEAGAENGLSDAEVLDIYPNHPERLLPELATAQWARVRALAEVHQRLQRPAE